MAKTADTGPKKSHSVRIHDDPWQRGRERAAREGYNINQVVGEILEGYASGLVNLPVIKKALGARNSHSVSVHNQVWAKARSRAKSEGSNVNAVVEIIVMGYAYGAISMPKIVKTYR